MVASDLMTIPIIVVSAVFLSLAWITVFIRLYVRQFLVKSLSWDDYTIVLATMGFTSFVGCILGIAELELHDSFLDIKTWELVAIYLPTSFAVYIITAVTFKISAAIFFLRILAKKGQRQLILGSIVLYTLFSIAYFFVDLFHCGNPVHYFENQILGHCMSYHHFVGPLTYTHTTLNAIIDWIFAIVPCFDVYHSQMSKHARMSVIAILALGVLGSICSVARLAFVNVLAAGIKRILITAPKFAMLSTAELGVGIIAINMATMRPLIKLIYRSSFSPYNSSGKASSKRSTGENSARDNQHDIELESGITYINADGEEGEALHDDHHHMPHLSHRRIRSAAFARDNKHDIELESVITYDNADGEEGEALHDAQQRSQSVSDDVKGVAYGGEDVDAEPYRDHAVREQPFTSL